MAKLTISLSETLKSFVDGQVSDRAYRTRSEYVRELICIDRDRCQLNELLMRGANSASGAPADRAYFNALRERATRRAPASGRAG